MPKLNYQLFNYFADDKRFSAEISDLQLPRGMSPFHLTNDGGVAKRSVVLVGKTGVEVEYVLAFTDANPREGEIYGYNLVPSKRSAAEVPACRGTKMLLIND
jgi:hypothetical protein